MTFQNYIILIILGVTVALFLIGRIRHDIVALLALLACVICGVVTPDDAFTGFSNPAVITVAAVLVLSNGLQTSGAVDILANRVLPKNSSLNSTVLVLLILGGGLSAFMNNVGAMALLMPLAIQIAQKNSIPPGRILMPLAFATILGGMTTLIGTPPNLIVSGYRSEVLGDGYHMFDFTPVGGAIAITGTLFLVLFASRLVPNRKPASSGNIDVGHYQTELIPRENSKAIGMSCSELEEKFKNADAHIIAIIRGGDTITDPNTEEKIAKGDVIILKAHVSLLQEGLLALGLEAPASITGAVGAQSPNFREVVVKVNSKLIGRCARDAGIGAQFGVNIVALWRGARAVEERLNRTPFEAGDVLLLQGDLDMISEFSQQMDCIPLAERDLELPNMRAPVVASLIMIGSILLAAFSILPTAIAFMIGAVLIVLTNIVPVRRLYDTIDWPVIVLLGAMLPVAAAMQTTGTADIIARFMLDHLAQGSVIIALLIVLVLTMFMSDIMNNAATAAVMCPIAIQSADALECNPDTFLMAVAIGASCAFLTPIGHQNNTLILGPSGFKFGDYWKFGLPLEVLIVAVAVPLLLIFWPL